MPANGKITRTQKIQHAQCTSRHSTRTRTRVKPKQNRKRHTHTHTQENDGRPEGAKRGDSKSQFNWQQSETYRIVSVTRARTNIKINGNVRGGQGKATLEKLREFSVSLPIFCLFRPFFFSLFLFFFALFFKGNDLITSQSLTLAR